MYNHNKAQQSKNRVHVSWDILYIETGSCVQTFCVRLTCESWRHQMKTFSGLLAICAGILRTKASDAELWCFLWSAPELMVENNREAGDLRRYRAHYDVTVMG